MTPEKEGEVIAKLDPLIELVREQQATLREHSAVLREHASIMREHDATMRGMSQHIAALAADVAEIKAYVTHMPQPAEFYELRGRVEEISRRLPTAIAYAPPARREPAE